MTSIADELRKIGTEDREKMLIETYKKHLQDVKIELAHSQDLRKNALEGKREFVPTSSKNLECNVVKKIAKDLTSENYGGLEYVVGDIYSCVLKVKW